MRMVDVIEKKAEGKRLTAKEIYFAVNGFTKGTVPDYQMSALLMAIRLNGMTEREGAQLTTAMMLSGEEVSLNDLPGVKVDKHSSGGVGDTTTLVVAPLVAACGGTVAKMSGRGLSFTGGTLDKLESIPGTCIEQPIDRFKEIVRQTGLCVIGQTGNLVPADKKMYALRDVTGTVASIPLIAASIMSKKLSAGADAIVLDVKVGSGAFIKTVEDAKKLAHIMVKMARLLDKRAVAVISDMNQPLGLAVGNALEVRDAVQLLCGKVPEKDPLYAICMILGTEMLLLSGLAKDEQDAKSKLKAAIKSGAGIEKLRSMVTMLGGDASYLTVDKVELLCKVKHIVEVPAQASGYVNAMEAELIGTAAQLLGAGRAKKSDPIDPSVGLVMHKRLGDLVQAGESLCTMYVNSEKNLRQAISTLTQAVSIGSKAPEKPPLVYAVIRD